MKKHISISNSTTSSISPIEPVDIQKLMNVATKIRKDTAKSFLGCSICVSDLLPPRSYLILVGRELYDEINKNDT